MCGINGIVGENEALVRAMNLATNHRGPDQTGVSAAHGATIGNNRLAIIDLSEAGRQPITSHDGRFTIVFNGEIYNYQAIKADLLAAGVVFKGGSDTEVILEGYAKWGRKIIDRLRGMWAFCIRDNQKGTLFLARDPFGIKPLYLYNDGQILAFSSEIKGLLAHPQVNRTTNPEAVRDLILLGYIRAPQTILSKVTSLLPGEEININLNDQAITREIVPLGFNSTSQTPSDEELEATLRDSIRHHLIADVPVGLFFSGGIDSTVLASLLHQEKIQLKAYHVAIPGRNDTRYAEVIAKELGLNLIKVPFSPSEALTALNRFWKIFDQPFADSSLLPTMIVSERAHEDVKVVLSGEGGDELFGGYTRHNRLENIQLDLNSSFSPGIFLPGLRALLQSFPSLISLLPKFQGLERYRRVRHNDAVGTYLAETANGLGLVPENKIHNEIQNRLKQYQTPDGVLAIDRLIYLPDDLLSKIDIATMSASIEGRVPFLDREVFKLVANAPLSWKRSGGLGKAPLRRLLAKQLPLSLINRPKSGFSVPLFDFIFKHEEKRLEAAIDWYSSTYPGLLPVFDSVLALVKKDKTGRVKNSISYSLYALLTLYIFHEQHLK